MCVKGAKFFARHGVQNIDETIRAIESAGGKIVMAKFHIPTVGTGVYFNDPEGNFAGAMQTEKPTL